MRSLLLLIPLLTFAFGCSSGNTDTKLMAECPPPVSLVPKSLFSKWYAIDCSETLTIAGEDQSLRSMRLEFVGGAICDCYGLVCGTQSEGSYFFQWCSYNGGGTDPGCSLLTKSGGGFTNTGYELTVCRENCQTYR